MDAQNSKCKLSDMVCFICTRDYFYVPSICRLKVLGMSMARGQALGTTSATSILVKYSTLVNFSFVYVSCICCICTNNKMHLFSINNMMPFFMCNCE
jgi:hypothetical protein